MSKHDKFFAAVYLVLTRENPETRKTEILLQLRQNVAYMNNKYDVAAAGHIDAGETSKRAMVREAREEIGIEISEDDLEFLLFVDAAEIDYLRIFFTAKKFSGEPRICEPEKCGNLRWFEIDNLPENIVPYFPAELDFIRNKIPFMTSQDLPS